MVKRLKQNQCMLKTVNTIMYNSMLLLECNRNSVLCYIAIHFSILK